ncbi:protein kinase domain-containing protein [Bremerella sp.]|uniref:serine/threonine protein kinase n=1 Tax=Bremerella sp. TaxID=2795602 RepID=UPI00391CA20B
MSNTPPSGDASNDAKFLEILVQCLEQLEHGKSIDRVRLLSQYPQYAEQLETFLADQDLLIRVAEDAREATRKSRSDEYPSNAMEATVDSHAEERPFQLGKQVRYIGHYEIVEEVARGGMGVVFKAKQESLKRIVALKLILSGQLASEKDIARFQREAQAAGQLQHPNIVAIHETGQHDGYHYFTMDFIEGQSLADILREKTLVPKQAAELVRQLAQAIDYAHQQGTLHRDLKPSNILLDKQGTPHVTDFGLAKITTDASDDAELTTTGQILGTPNYMSPEQAAGQQTSVGPTSDVYSLGAVLYACLTGRAPFVEESTMATLQAVIKDEPVRPRNLNRSIPRDLEQICLKCLAKRPDERYPSAAMLEEDLARFLADEPVQARPLSTLTRWYRWSDRNIGTFTMYMIGGVSLLPLIVFLGLGLLMQRWPPIQLLLFAYPLMLLLISPFVMSMLLYSTTIRLHRQTTTNYVFGKREKPSMLLIVLGIVLIASGIAGYAWALYTYNWQVPRETALLAIVIISGIGLVIRGSQVNQ